jgi:membrane protein DedA with SNARE-associated domain/rhodanese-related sulfurtransferase
LHYVEEHTMLSRELIERYAGLVVFLNVLGASLGLPLPVMPTLVTVGATVAIAAGGVSSVLTHFAAHLGVAIVGGVAGDLVWFAGGKRYGERTLHTVCKLSLSQETCVKKTERFFGRWGVRVLIVARFVPGLSLVAVPLCGAMAIKLRSFIVHDCLGVALWAAAGLTIGGLFAAQFDRIFRAVSHVGWQTFGIAGVAVAAYLLYRYGRRIVLAKGLEKARISVDELHALLASNARPVVLDIRSPERRMLDPFMIPSAEPADERQLGDIVRCYGTNRTIVIYCSCPNEVSAAWMAKRLHLAGVKLVLPLAGGIDAWRATGFEVVRLRQTSADGVAAVQGKLAA